MNQKEVLDLLDHEGIQYTYFEHPAVYTMEEMRLLIHHAENVAAHLAEAINSGEIAASPLRFPNEDSPCASCEAADICRRNAPHSGVTDRNAEKMDLSELIGRLQEE